MPQENASVLRGISPGRCRKPNRGHLPEMKVNWNVHSFYHDTDSQSAVARGHEVVDTGPKHLFTQEG